MYICLCHGITDKQIQQAVREHGVGSIRELKKTYPVASQCGKCVQAAQQVIDRTIIDESLFKEVC